MNANGSVLSIIAALVLALIFIGHRAPQLREGVAIVREGVALVRATSLSLFRWGYESPLWFLKCATGTPWFLFACARWLLLMGLLLVLYTTLPLVVIVTDWMSPGPGAALPALHVKLGIAACYLFGARIIGVAFRTLRSGQVDGGRSAATAHPHGAV